MLPLLHCFCCTFKLNLTSFGTTKSCYCQIRFYCSYHCSVYFCSVSISVITHFSTCSSFYIYTLVMLCDDSDILSPVFYAYIFFFIDRHGIKEFCLCLITIQIRSSALFEIHFSMFICKRY